MIGNSLKSDILPLVNLKAHAIHVRFILLGHMNRLQKKKPMVKPIKPLIV